MIWTQLAMGVLSSILAAGLFLYILSRLKPKISISDVISKNKTKENDTEYKIKIINHGKRDAINLKMEVSLMINKNVFGGVVYNSQQLTLKKSEWFILPSYKANDKEARYALRITILEDLEKIWSDDSTQYLRIKVFAQDEMSNFGKVFEKEYRTIRNSIKEGSFAFGDTMKVL